MYELCTLYIHWMLEIVLRVVIKCYKNFNHCKLILIKASSRGVNKAR